MVEGLDHRGLVGDRASGLSGLGKRGRAITFALKQPTAMRAYSAHAA